MNGPVAVKLRRRGQWWLASVCVAASVMFLSLRNDAYFRLAALSPPSSGRLDGDRHHEDCLRARNDLVPPSMRGASYLVAPIINLGMPKMGTSSLQHFFGCAGYGSSHFWCGPKTLCARCIRESVRGGLPPLEKCGGGPVYTQIDGSGRNFSMYFPQVHLLDEIVGGGYRDNATYLLPFRDMGGWHRSVTHWRGGRRNNLPPLSERMARAGINVTGLGLGNFTDFFCGHVRRVRAAVPAGRLVEVDIEDPRAGKLLAEIFDVDEGCWAHANANARLRRGDDENDRNATTTGAGAGAGVGGTTIDDDDEGRRSSSPPLTPPQIAAAIKVTDRMVGKAMIRGKDGTMRKNPTFVAGGGAKAIVTVTVGNSFS